VNSHRRNLRTLLHQTADGEPETVLKGELVLQFFWFLYAGIRIVPLIRADPATEVSKLAENN
jgi:hypothetical protein